MLTYQEMLRRQDVIAQKARHVRALQIKRAQAAVVACGLDPNSFGCTGHNALIDFRAGRPWKGVDYHMLRYARWLFTKSYRPDQITQESWTRLYAQWRADGFQYETVDKSTRNA